MAKRIQFQNSPNQYMEIQALPDVCPHCGKRIAAKYINSFIKTSDDGNRTKAIVYWFCNGCGEFFAATYFVNKDYPNNYVGYEDSVIPPIMEKTVLPAEVLSVSPGFAELFQQAERAKNEGMTDLAGMGFRKALECLLKDTLIYLGQDETQVEKMTIAGAIEAFADNPRLQRAATNARVIGNDYTHYKARYDGYDIETLRQLISITCHWVCMEIETENLVAPQKKT